MLAVLIRAVGSTKTILRALRSEDRLEPLADAGRSGPLAGRAFKMSSREIPQAGVSDGRPGAQVSRAQQLELDRCVVARPHGVGC